MKRAPLRLAQIAKSGLYLLACPSQHSPDRCRVWWWENVPGGTLYEVWHVVYQSRAPAPHVLALAMVDALVMITNFLEEVVALGRIGADCARGYRLGHWRFQALALHIWHDGQDYLTLFSSHHRDYRRAIFGGAASPSSALLAPPPRGKRQRSGARATRLALVPSPNVDLVYLNGPCQDAARLQVEHLFPHQPDDTTGRVVVTRHLSGDGSRALGQLGQVEAVEPGREGQFRALKDRAGLVVETPPASATLMPSTGRLSEVDPALNDMVTATVGTAHFPIRPLELAKLPIALGFIQ